MAKRKNKFTINIKFNKNFYRLKAVQDSLRVYEKFAVCELKKNQDYIEVNFRDIDEDVKGILKGEFCNYVLAEMQNTR